MIMLKQTYMKPDMEAVAFESEVLMNITSSEQTGAGTGDGSADDNDPELISRRRGMWGNFWE